MLLTGDLEGEGEKSVAALLRSNAITGISVLKVAHHGSKILPKKNFCGSAVLQLRLSPAVSTTPMGILTKKPWKDLKIWEPPFTGPTAAVPYR